MEKVKILTVGAGAVGAYFTGRLAQAGAGVALKRFCFFVRGEGLEKKNEDLSEEVAKQVEAMKK